MNALDAAAVKKNSITDFFETERKKLLNYIRKNLRDAGDRDAEDILQDTMLSVIDNFSLGSMITNIGAYVYRSLKNRIVDQYRKKSGKDYSLDAIAETMGGGSLADILADEKYDTHNELEKKELRERIFQAVEDLPDAQKAVWIATELDGFTFEELSLMWQEPLGTLLARKHRAVLALREELADYYL